MMKFYKILFVFLVLLPAVVSCRKMQTPYRGNAINVRVTSADTKGTVTTTDVLKSSGAFSMMAYLSDAYIQRDENGVPEMEDGVPKLYDGENGLYFTGNGNVTISSGSWVIADAPCWVDKVDTYFWAWHPVSVASRSITGPVAASTEYPTDPDAPRHPYTGELEFKYTTPTPDEATDADRAVDLLFAYSKKKHVTKKNPSDGDNAINITFHHALSQVRFCVSTDDGTFDKSLKIKSVSISNLKNYGEATFSDSGNAENNQFAYEPDSLSYDKFVWKNQTGNKTFGQTYNADFSTSTVSGWTKGSYKNNTKTYTLYTCQNVFFMIPQTVVTGSTTETSNMLKVVFEYNGKETTKSVYITGSDTSGASTTWLGDHYYTYKIKATTVGRDIDLSVSLIGWSNRKEEIFI